MNKKFNDLDRCFLNPEDELYLNELATRFNIQHKDTLKTLNSKKKKNLNAKLTKKGQNPRETNELFWLDKNEIQTAREELALDSIAIVTRNCLSCYESFESEGKHNRLCDDCRKGVGL